MERAKPRKGEVIGGKQLPTIARRSGGPGLSSIRVAGVSVALLAMSSLGLAGAETSPSERAAGRSVNRVSTADNPEIDDSCGIDVALVLDASGSISAAGAVGDVRDAGMSFLEALADTNSTARVVDFGTVARETAASTQVTAASVAPGGVHAEAMDAYYNPKPPLQPGVTSHRYNGGPVSSPGSYSSQTDTQYTNWDQALHQAGQGAPDLVVFVTDGEPSAVDSDQPGDPFYVAGQDPPNVRFGMDRTAESQELILDRSVEEANAAKGAGSRVLAVGVGDAFGSGEAVDRLEAVSGPLVISNPDDITDLNAVDVALVQDFDRLSDVLRRLVTELCSPSLTIRKLAQTAGSEAYVPTPGWTMTVEPAVDTADAPPYEWVLPVAGAPVGPQSSVTDENGFASFQWEPNPATSTSTATVTETVQAGFTPRDYTCQERLPDGSVNETSGDLDGSSPSFDLDVGAESIVTCTIRNDFDYDPGIHIEKSNSPLVVRGDGGGSTVTSTYEVTNTGNTPLVVSTPADDRCADVTYQSGDTDGDQRLDLTETWIYTCDRLVQAGLTDQAITIDNHVTVTGTAPDGSTVEDDDTASVEVIIPDIVVDKSVDQGVVEVGTEVTYTYEVHTNGNTPLSDVTVADDTCAPATYQSGDDGDDLLEPGEIWTYTCTTAVFEDVVNTATASGTPPIGPDVDDEDKVFVQVIHPDMNLAKTVDRHLVLPGTLVDYTFVVSNDGDADLVPTVPSDRSTFVTDDHCTPSYESGDVGDDEVLSPGESWTYRCEAVIDAATINRAEADATVDGTDTRIVRVARQFVVPIPPAVHVEKFASAPIVYTGTDVTYTYEVTNPGLAPLQDVIVTDDRCASPAYQSGDDGDAVLQRGELWIYTCTSNLAKADLSSDVPETVVNTATVIGTPVVGDLVGEPVTDEAIASVEVIDPALTIDKVASAEEVRVGGDVTYTVTVTNTGDSPLRFVAVVDTRCNPLTYQSGDTGADRVAAPGEAWVYTCTKAVHEDTTNTAGVVGVDILGGLLADTDPAAVTVFDPGIALTKTVEEHFVPIGEAVTYTFEVANTGTDPLTEVAIIDSRCSPVAFVGGDMNGDDVLDLTETWTYTCTGEVHDPHVNVAGVRGLDHLGDPVRSVGADFVVPYEAGIAVEKTASETVLVGGGEVTYTYEVTNTGNVPLANVADQITDDTCAPVTYVGGDDDGNDLLTGDSDLFETGPPEVWTFTCATEVTVDTTNTVDVDGTPVRPRPGGFVPLGPDVHGRDQATVVVTVAPETVPPTTPITPTTPATAPEVTPADADDGALPRTGADLRWLLAIGVAAVAAGALVHRSGARLRRSSPQ